MVALQTASAGKEAGAEKCQWALRTEKRTLGAAAHLSWEILVSLRTAASAEAPSSPKLLPWTLQSMGEVGVVRDEACQWALTKRRTLSGGGALEVGDHRLLEDGCERGGALVSDLVPPDTAKHG